MMGNMKAAIKREQMKTRFHSVEHEQARQNVDALELCLLAKEGTQEGREHPKCWTWWFI